MIGAPANTQDQLSQLLLSAAFVMISIGLFEPIMGWILVLMACAVVIRAAYALGVQSQTVSMTTVNLLALLAGLVLAYFSVQLGLLVAMVNLLAMACALKLMLMRRRKDFRQLIVSALFLLGCGFIFHQSMAMSGYFSLCLGVILLAMMARHGPQLTLPQLTGGLGRLLLQALPIAVLAFMVMPRLGPFWQMPTAKSTETGLADRMKPGDIAQLSQSSALAFRASFTDNIPPPNQRYWRALVMEQFDGQEWQIAPRRKWEEEQLRLQNKAFVPAPQGPGAAYQVIAEPSYQHYLFSLDVSVVSDPGVRKRVWPGTAYQLRSRDPVASKMQYDLVYYPQTPLNQTNYSLDRQLNLQVPRQGNPRTREWVAKLQQQSTSARMLIDNIQRYFQQQGFEYTLRPALMPNDPVDRFLFDNQAGFCAHYASALAFALRLADIPARVVAGYQGGEVRGDDYVSIYQYDAHAWVEAWLDDQGWVRLDPTAWVAPSRILYGLERAVAEEGTFLADDPLSLARLKDYAWLNQVRLLLADMDFLWSQWVLGFDANRQRDLFKSLLGKLTAFNLSLVGVVSVLLVTILLAVYFIPKRAPRRPLWQKRYHQALALLEPVWPRPRHYGPDDYVRHVNQTAPADIAGPFNQLTQLYMYLAYQRPSAASQRDTDTRMNRAYLRLKRALGQHRPPASAR
ncbi:transglutaminaseTgpA domain-containing protein [Aestuariibacter halophilus]|uniref:TransglutaminaseTgpA domain-containing protein n=1 Tax=Fluctibacter halophilus TaxID=226011 RepID=A0ABS8G6H6_9ALTE|nr:DUF3488 and DUF4129 domain-containing transglutaminase family protein [Aestuariibacter halophilus]MCC2616008.1 transglutaminaseTgpA domain-containing protein [Aestuariibacter halophilus]